MSLNDYFFRVLGIAVIGAVLLMSSGVMLPVAANLAQKAAMLSAAAAMPEGIIGSVKERFAGELYSDTDPESRQPQSAQTPEQQQWPAAHTVPESSQTPPPTIPKELPNIPESRRRSVLSENMSGFGNSNYLQFHKALVRNDTRFSFDEIKSVLEEPMELKLSDTQEPQVLIVHTHATEAYTPFDMDYYDTEYTWRTTDNNENIIAVGAALAQAIEASGIAVLHDKTLHDYPSYNGGYERSAVTVKKYLQEYPSIKVVFDVHRDAIERDGEVIVKPTVEIDGQKAAQLMIISCADSGSIGIPNWERNFRFAAALASAANEKYPGIMRPIFLSHRKYNQHLSDGSLLLEFGSHASTLEEALYTARLTGSVFGELLRGTTSMGAGEG